MSLLPPSATKLLRVLERTHNGEETFDPALQKLRELKSSPLENLLYWLVWEYGLEAILPYSEDMRRLLKDGLVWQRIRGTPGALKTALTWLGLDQAELEQASPGRHFYEYQINPALIPGDRDVARVFYLAQLSAPARARLARIYFGYDVRKFALSTSRFGDFLSDHSGVRFEGGGVEKTKVSFGRRHGTGADFGEADVGRALTRERIRTTSYIKGMRLGGFVLGQGHQQGAAVTGGRRHQYISAYSLSGHSWLGGWAADVWASADYLQVANVHHASY